MADDVTIQIGGTAAGAVSAANQASSAVQQLGSASSEAGGHMDLLRTVLGPLGGALEQVAGRARMVIETMFLWRSLDFIQQQIEGWTSALFELNNTMERTQVSWMFLFGTGNNAASKNMAQSLADWTKIQSYNFPFTRQDMLGAINAAGMATQDPNLIKQYLPTIADIASVRTNFAGQPVTLQQAMYALAMANEGMSRMLKYDLKITPEDLKKYGWDEKAHNFQNLLESLQKYNAAHHLAGASDYVAHNTFFGEWSSFQDRIQNMQLLIGKNMFTALKDDLNNFTSWWDQHQQQLNAIGEWMGTKIGNGIRNLTEFGRDFALGAFFGTNFVTNAGTNATLTEARMNAEKTLGTPGTLAGVLGALANSSLKDTLSLLRGILQTGPLANGTFIQPLKALAEALGSKGAQEFFTEVGRVLGLVQNTVVTTALNLLMHFFEAVGQTGAGNALLGLITALDGLVTSLQPFLETLGTFLGSWAGLVAGNALQLAATLITTLANSAKDFMHSDFAKWLQAQLAPAFRDLKQAFMDFKNSFTPQEWQTLTMVVKALGVALLALPLLAIIGGIKVTTFVIEVLTHAVQLAGGYIGMLGNVLGGLVQMLQQADTWITHARQAIENLGIAISLKFNGLITQAKTWGLDLITNLAKGIEQGLNVLQSALDTVGKAIAGKLGHSVPKEGPLKDELTWMPHMIDNLANSLLASAPVLTRATATVAGQMAQVWSTALSSNTTTNYGNLYQTIHGPSTATLDATISAAMRANGRQVVLASNTPGAFTRFGYRGGR